MTLNSSFNSTDEFHRGCQKSQSPLLRTTVTQTIRPHNQMLSLY